jgi:hypothetical protein
LVVPLKIFNFASSCSLTVALGEFVEEDEAVALLSLLLLLAG